MRAQNCRKKQTLAHPIKQQFKHERPNAIDNLKHILLPLMGVFSLWTGIDILFLYVTNSLNTLSLYFAFTHSVLTTIISFSCVALGQWLFHKRFLKTYIIRLFRQEERAQDF